MEQTVEFQSFRMRTFMVKGNSPCSRKGNSFMVLKPQNRIVQRCRSKAFSPACLFRFSESSAPYPIPTQSLDRGGEGWGRRKRDVGEPRGGLLKRAAAPACW